MVRIIATFAALLAGCVASDDPSIAVSVGTDEVQIWINRGPDHSFGHVSATINGVDAGAPQFIAGHESLRYGTSAASAVFFLRQPQIGSGLHIEIDDDGAQYTLDAPDVGLPRTPTVVTPLDVPLRRGDWVELTTGIASDRIGNQDTWMIGKLASQPEDYCFTQSAMDIRDGSTKFQVPPVFETGDWTGDTWICYGEPIPTSGTLAIKLDFRLEVAPAITTCTGPALTCDVQLSVPAMTFDATLRL